ncbi:MAG: hypothetical protein LBG24_07060 [Treponema sp.]|jgi:hypothetical protein|nr:hypothetical protein [Treponema sp.]
MDPQEKERLITDAAAEFEAAQAERNLTISVIEALWGATRQVSDEILRRLYSELASNSGEPLLSGGLYVRQVSCWLVWGAS